jgi:hypothetical protein
VVEWPFIPGPFTWTGVIVRKEVEPQLASPTKQPISKH